MGRGASAQPCQSAHVLHAVFYLRAGANSRVGNKFQANEPTSPTPLTRSSDTATRHLITYMCRRRSSAAPMGGFPIGFTFFFQSRGITGLMSFFQFDFSRITRTVWPVSSADETVVQLCPTGFSLLRCCACARIWRLVMALMADVVMADEGRQLYLTRTSSQPVVLASLLPSPGNVCHLPFPRSVRPLPPLFLAKNILDDSNGQRAQHNYSCELSDSHRKVIRQAKTIQPPFLLRWHVWRRIRR